MAAEPPELAEGITPAARARELERELRLMGPINPLALEEFDALQERHAFLAGAARRREGAPAASSRKVIRAIDDEIVDVFAAAFADVSQNFEALFETLFPGGQGRLRLTEPDDLLETGIEVEAKPSGKNVRKLSLLSGGERSLTALAFLFAVFRSRPSPFYLMDEVEAALDDVNLHRFLDLVARVPPGGPAAHRQPPEAHDGGGRLLYGVTMQPGGSQQGRQRAGHRRRLSAPARPVSGRVPDASTLLDAMELVLVAVLVVARRSAGAGLVVTRRRRDDAPSSRRPPAEARPPAADRVVDERRRRRRGAEVDAAPRSPRRRVKPRLPRPAGQGPERARRATSARVLARDKVDDETWDDLEEALIRADVGVAATTDILERPASHGRGRGHHRARRRCSRR